MQACYFYPNSRWVAPTAFLFEKPRVDEIDSLTRKLFQSILPYDQVKVLQSCLFPATCGPEKMISSSDSDDSDVEDSESQSDSDDSDIENRRSPARALIPSEYLSDGDSDDDVDPDIEDLSITCDNIVLSCSENKADRLAVAIAKFVIQELPLGTCLGHSYTQLLLQSPKIEPQYKTREYQRGHILFFQVIDRIIQLVEDVVERIHECEKVHLAHVEKIASRAEVLPQILDVKMKYSRCYELEKYGNHWAQLKKSAFDAMGAKKRNIHTEERKPNQSQKDFAQAVTVSLRSIFSSSHDEYLIGVGYNGQWHMIYVQLSSRKIVDIMHKGSFVFPSIEDLIETIGRDSIMRPWDEFEVFVFN